MNKVASVLKKGDTVVMHTCAESRLPKYEGKVWTCQTDEQKLAPSHNYTVVWLEGFRGCFAAKYLKKVEESEHA